MIDRTFGQGFGSVYREGQLTLGLNFPIEAYVSPVPNMLDQITLARRAEEGGFAALWSRDVPLLDPSFGDAGQMYDPWVWLGYVAAQTAQIALGTGAIILPLRRPVDLAKAAASVDQLSAGRLIMGVASGDRPVEYSAYQAPFDSRDEAFRETLEFIRRTTHRPEHWDNQDAVRSRQVQLLPKAHAGDIPLFVTGNSRQSLDWIAANADGWLMYPRPIEQQRQVLSSWQSAVQAAGHGWKPFSQSLYIDLTADPNTQPNPIHLGYRLGRKALLAHLAQLRDIGVNHVSLNLRFSSRPVAEVLDELCEFVVPKR
uniref:LLM class oxidoreductase n=1 Tax=Marinobacterium profundum TaxID=1714300 RepID=UPI00083380E4|nr:LLM class oxidoreductase [Marinobacterium profundum]